jgi:alanine racemase
MFRIATTITVLLSATLAYADDEAVIVQGKAAVTAKLIDPDSARFVDVQSSGSGSLKLGRRDRYSLVRPGKWLFGPTPAARDRPAARPVPVDQRASRGSSMKTVQDHAPIGEN